MSELLFLQDAYLKVFTATVAALKDGGIILDRTAFYPAGGGQPSDLGTLSGDESSWMVTKVKKIGGKPVHFVDGDQPAVGTAVTGQLDWERRYQLMRTHTAMHILCGVVWRDYGASVTGGNMDPLKGRMDFEFETMHQDLVTAIEESVNQEVAACRPV